MSRHILSRPRTRVYGCNYDKGESYYKPMVDHLDRKYSGRPLFPEPRNSIADEIAARRSDIGTRDLAGSRQTTLGREFEPEFEARPRTLPTLSHDPFFDDGDETVFDIRGQRTSRTRRLPLSEDFANEVASTTRKLKSRVAAFNLDATEALDAETGFKSRSEKLFHDTAKSARSALEDAESAFRRRPRFRTDEPDIPEERPTRWSKLLDSSDPLEDLTSAAAGRAKLTKARLNDLETEMEEMAEKQAKRERRAAALRALVNESALADDSLLASSNISSKTSLRSERAERAEKHKELRNTNRFCLSTNVSGSRGLAGNYSEFDDFDFYDGRGRMIPEENMDEDYVATHRRFRERAAAAFEEDLAELRRKRRDMQDRMFDMIDLNAEIERAKNTLEQADSAFGRHSLKFNNQEEDVENMSLAQRIERNRKLAAIDVSDKPEPKPKPPMVKWMNVNSPEKCSSESPFSNPPFSKRKKITSL